jgi:uncharacterized protein
MQPFTLLIKPSGSDCNLDCKYCFYKNRPSEVRQGKQRMSKEVLEKLVRDYLGLNFPVATFAWQGGEPTLMGLDFYAGAVELQKKYGTPNQQINNTLQTNAILLDEKWCRFLHDNNFLVGVSIDGPKEFHDHYRRDFSSAGTFDRVIEAVENLKKYKVEFNVLVLLNDKNASHPNELFDFFIERNIRYLQFVPCVEFDRTTGKAADFSVTAAQYGEFMCRLLDRWCKHGLNKLSIRDFDSILSWCINGKHTLCTFDKRCASYIVVEHNGDAFCCDFFVEPQWRLGNILETNIGALAASSRKLSFIRAKQNLSNECFLCRHVNLCRSGCMKDKMSFLKNQVNSRSYLCEGYKMFFDYAMPQFMQIAATVNAYTARKA